MKTGSAKQKQLNAFSKKLQKMCAERMGKKAGLKIAAPRCSACGRLGHKKKSPVCTGFMKPPLKRTPKVLTPEEQQRKDEMREQFMKEAMDNAVAPSWRNISPDDIREDSGISGVLLL